MLLEKNPFFLLGVTPYDNEEIIENAASEKSFLDDNHEREYDEARTILLSPVKRLGAEVRWIFEFDNHDKIIEKLKGTEFWSEFESESCRECLIKNIELLYGIESPNEENHQKQLYSAALILLAISRCYEDMLASDSVDNVLQTINSARRRAHIGLCKDKELVRNELKTLKKDANESISTVFTKFSEEQIVKIANFVADAENKGNDNFGELVDYFISAYGTYISDRLNEKKDEILSDINIAKKFTKTEELKVLCDKVRAFDYYAQPLQLYLQSIGRSSAQEESVIVATELRKLAIYYHNEKGLTELSKVLVDLEIELFSELREFLPILNKDKEFIDCEVNKKSVNLKSTVQKNMRQCAENITSRSFLRSTITSMSKWFYSHIRLIIVLVVIVGAWYGYRAVDRHMTENIRQTISWVRYGFYGTWNDTLFDDHFMNKTVLVFDKYRSFDFDKYHKKLNWNGFGTVDYCVYIARYDDTYVCQYRGPNSKIIPGYQRKAELYVYDIKSRRCLGRKEIYGEKPKERYNVTYVPDAFYGEINDKIMDWVYEHWKFSE